jgi:chromosome segregation ATPase
MATKKRRMRKTKRIRGGGGRGTKRSISSRSSNQEGEPNKMIYPNYYNTGHIPLKPELANINMRKAVSNFLGEFRNSSGTIDSGYNSGYNSREGDEMTVSDKTNTPPIKKRLLQKELTNENEALILLIKKQKEIEENIEKNTKQIEQIELSSRNRGFFRRLSNRASKSMQHIRGIETEEQRLRNELEGLLKERSKLIKRINDQKEYIKIHFDS